MRTPASIAGHPVHPMIVPIAIGGFILSFIFDIVNVASGNMDPWATVAYYTMIGGIVGALCAAIFGFTDLLSIPAGHVRNIAYTHMGLNLTIVVLFIIDAVWRHGAPDTIKGPMILSLIALLMLIVSGWLGGKMVYEHAIGVDTAGEPTGEAPRPHTGRHLEA